MPKNRKSIAVLTLMLLISMVAAACVNLNVASVGAQGQATVNVLDSVGGTTDPAAGTYSYDDGTAVILTATPDESYFLLYWIIETNTGTNLDSDNPATLTVSANIIYSVQPVFSPLTIPISPYFPPLNTTTDAFVVVLASAGGTTNPPPRNICFSQCDAIHSDSGSRQRLEVFALGYLRWSHDRAWRVTLHCDANGQPLHC